MNDTELTFRAFSDAYKKSLEEEDIEYQIGILTKCFHYGYFWDESEEQFISIMKVNQELQPKIMENVVNHINGMRKEIEEKERKERHICSVFTIENIYRENGVEYPLNQGE